MAFTRIYRSAHVDAEKNIHARQAFHGRMNIRSTIPHDTTHKRRTRDSSTTTADSAPYNSARLHTLTASAPCTDGERDASLRRACVHSAECACARGHARLQLRIPSPAPNPIPSAHSSSYVYFGRASLERVSRSRYPLAPTHLPLHLRGKRKLRSLGRAHMLRGLPRRTVTS